ISHIVLMKRKTLIFLVMTGCFSFCFSLRIAYGELALNSISGGSFFIKPWPDAGLALTFTLSSVIRHYLLELLSPQLRKLQIVKHNSYQLFQGNVCLYCINARLISSALTDARVTGGAFIDYVS